jgi:hypothetical protein
MMVKSTKESICTLQATKHYKGQHPNEGLMFRENKSKLKRDKTLWQIALMNS